MKYTQEDLAETHKKIIEVQNAEGETNKYWELLSTYAEIKKSLEPHVRNHREIIESHIGDYITFGGHGIMYGLKNAHFKWDYYQIVGYDGDDLLLKQYRAKYTRVLPYNMQDREYRIISKAEYAKRPAPTSC